MRNPIQDIENTQNQIRVNNEDIAEIKARIKMKEEDLAYDRIILAALNLPSEFWFTPNKGIRE